MKVKWKVDEAPTGPYRTFFKRGWPTARSECQFFFMVRCEDEYVSAKVKAGDHGPLTLVFRDDSNPGGKIRRFTRTFATLGEVKEFVSKLEASKLRK